jgi:hypothetical protein
MLLDELGIDLNTPSATEIEDGIKAGPIAPEGMHHAILEGFREGSANNGRKFRELIFKIIAGPGKGQTIKETLWNSDEPRGKNRILLFMHRCGLLTRGADDKFQRIEGKGEFSDVIGAQVIVDVKHKTREYEKDGEKRKVTDAILSFEGVLPLDDKRCEKVPRAGGAAVAAAVASAPPKPEYGEL